MSGDRQKKKDKSKNLNPTTSLLTTGHFKQLTTWIKQGYSYFVKDSLKKCI